MITIIIVIVPIILSFYSYSLKKYLDEVIESLANKTEITIRHLVKK